MKTDTLTVTMSLTFPFVKPFSYYNEIGRHYDNLVSDFQPKSERKLLYREVAFDGTYWGLFYLEGRKPKLSELKELLEKEGYNQKLSHLGINSP